MLSVSVNRFLTSLGHRGEVAEKHAYFCSATCWYSACADDLAAMTGSTLRLLWGTNRKIYEAISTIVTHMVCAFHKLVRISRVQFRVEWIHLLALAARAISPANRSDLVPGLTLAVRTTKPRATASAASGIGDGWQCDDESGCKSENDLSHIVPRC
jgi:hypothetical protein